MHKKSFSLIELLVTMAIMVILVSIAIPRILPLNKYYLIHELEKLTVTFKYLQQKAIASNIAQVVTFDIKNQSYTFPAPGGMVTTYKLPNGILFGTLKNILGPPAKPTHLITDPITFKKDHKKDALPVFQATFFTNGQISSGAAYLIDCDEKVMGAFTCAVSQVSYIRVYVYEKNAWKVHAV